MLAYGDDAVEVSLGSFLDGFDRRLKTAGALDDVRQLLIFAGQLQQAAEDGGHSCASETGELTAATADAFVSAATGRSIDVSSISRALSALRTTTARDRHLQLSLKTPEGFAWYRLYPDAYVQAAQLWLPKQASSPILVAGIRSIGTALGAVVAATLRARGLEVRSCTVRPSGHPFQRRCDLPPALTNDATHAIVVDEGPGLSGSSMASVAEALSALGFDAGRITFFPGHPHGPGPQSSESVRRWWASVKQVTVDWDDLLIGGQRAQQRLANAAAAALGRPLDGPLSDVGGGRWRDPWPEAEKPLLGFAPLFEAPKLLAQASGGRVLLKFAGLHLAGTGPGGCLLSGAERQMNKLEDLAGAGLTPAPLGCADGWIILPWIDGLNLSHSRPTEAILSHMAGYIARAAEPPLEPRQARSAGLRLRDILCTNAGHLLGEKGRDRAQRISDALLSDIEQLALPSYGDGRLAPHEWIRTEDRILKVDAGGHAKDHTAVGQQTLLWDIAGAAVDWRLDHDVACDLARAAGASGISSEAISYYCAAYAAYRAGLLHYCVTSSRTVVDRQALTLAQQMYAERLQIELDRMDTFVPLRTYITARPQYAR